MLPKSAIINGYITYTDYDPSVDMANQYRFTLKTAQDPTPQYSDIVTLDFSNLLDFSLYPNPATDYVDINIHKFKIEQATIRLVNLLGNEVFQQKVTQQTNSIRITLDNIPIGQYILYMDIKGKRSIAKKLTVSR